MKGPLRMSKSNKVTRADLWVALDNLRGETATLRGAMADLRHSVVGLRDAVQECRDLLRGALAAMEADRAAPAKAVADAALFAKFPTGTFLNKPPSDGLSERGA